MLKEMDPDLVLSDEIRGDLMLEAAGLSQTEQLMVLTSTNNDTDFDKIAEALQKQHGKIHIRNSLPTRSFGGGGPLLSRERRGARVVPRRAGTGAPEGALPATPASPHALAHSLAPHGGRPPTRRLRLPSSSSDSPAYYTT